MSVVCKALYFSSKGRLRKRSVLARKGFIEMVRQGQLAIIMLALAVPNQLLLVLQR